MLGFSTALNQKNALCCSRKKFDGMGSSEKKRRKKLISTRFTTKLKKSKKRKTWLSNFDIEEFIGSIPRFFGTIFDNDVETLDTKTEGYYIVNLDHANGPGTHLIALGIFKDTIEFFDPLGCDFLNWPNLPVGLLKFLFQASFDKTIVKNQRLQSSTSSVCGLYCIFYIIHRENFSLQTILDYFDESCIENDKKLIRYFQ